MRAPDFWTRKDRASRLLASFLSPIGWIYGASVRLRAHNASPYRTDAKVICVGNLTAGGTGKTPIAIALARLLSARGLKPVFLSRGYGGRTRGPLLVDDRAHSASDVGDEPLLLAQAAPVIVARDRREGAALADSYAPDVILMDDGHQNFAVAKDLSLVVIDAKDAFGNGYMLPAGPLREPVQQGLDRADAVILIGEGTPRLGAWARPLLRAHMQPNSAKDLANRRVVAFAGIGQPRKFFDTVQSLGAQIVEQIAFPDHHAYSAAELARLKAKARARDASLVTTEKDFMRLTHAEREEISAVPVHAVFDDCRALDALLDRIAPAALARSSA